MWDKLSPKDRTEFKRYARKVQRSLVPKIAGSAYVMAIAPTGGEADVKMAIEVGFAILMDKPLIVLAPPGRVVAPKLLRIADHVIRADMSTEAGRVEAQEKLFLLLRQ